MCVYVGTYHARSDQVYSRVWLVMQICDFDFWLQRSLLCQTRSDLNHNCFDVSLAKVNEVRPSSDLFTNLWTTQYSTQSLTSTANLVRRRLFLILDVTMVLKVNEYNSIQLLSHNLCLICRSGVACYYPKKLRSDTFHRWKRSCRPGIKLTRRWFLCPVWGIKGKSSSRPEIGIFRKFRWFVTSSVLLKT
jgi:hypothetical protein